MTRAIPERAREFIKGSEKLRLVGYPDQGGVATDGWGNTHGAVIGKRINQAKAKQDLEFNLATAARQLEGMIGAAAVLKLTESAYCALLSFVFNLGADPGWTLWKLIKAGKTSGNTITDQMKRFVNVRDQKTKKLVRSQGLVARRAAEVSLWHEDDAAPGAPGGDDFHPAALAEMPSSTTRSAETPPTPAGDAKPLVNSKTMWAGGGLVATGALNGVTQIQGLISTQAANSEIVAHMGQIVAALIVALGVAVMVFRSLDERAKHK